MTESRRPVCGIYCQPKVAVVVTEAVVVFYVTVPVYHLAIADSIATAIMDGIGGHQCHHSSVVCC